MAWARRLVFIGLERERRELYERIDRRVLMMIDQGLADEVRGLLDRGYGPELNAMQTLGYKHMVNVLTGRWRLDEAIALLQRDTRRYAKRQLTWFRGEEGVSWHHPEDMDGVMSVIEQKISRAQ